MKKTLVTLSVLSATSAAFAAPDANTFYLGAKAGWASTHKDINQFDSKYQNDKRYNPEFTTWGIHRNSVTYGVFGGYQIFNQNKMGLALELGYDYYGQMKGSSQNKVALDVPTPRGPRPPIHKPKPKGDLNRQFKHTAHGANLSLKPSYEILPNLDVYGKVGMGLVRNDYKFILDLQSKDQHVKDETKLHTLKPSLLLGTGVEYAITPELALRTEYQYLNKAGNLYKAAKYKNISTSLAYAPDIHSVSVGLSYRFGQGGKIEPTPVVVEPEVVSKNFAFSSDVLFDFAKADLKQEAAQVLDATNAEIVNLGLATPAIQVNGYTDRIGKEEANLKLSQRRAEMVANYLVAKGQNPVSINAVGYGEANPITGNTCDAVKGRKQLIACLAPDRRVEVQVQGTKQITM
ncbi:membrane protein [[Haemophilus] ducreyi]|uniref:porin OmpA n=1 Tax=Haemophilus ducreyi TaxID=730 RepID=UPI000654E39F|nr:porin OmpA [[Haemophilus] ducreyi]AKO39025.1 membrane protein [[Haemophilus] ducreyi]